MMEERPKGNACSSQWRRESPKSDEQGLALDVAEGSQSKESLFGKKYSTVK